MPALMKPGLRRLITDHPHHHGILVGSDPRYARQARRWVVQTARVTHYLSQRLALVASELLANAWAHTRSGAPQGNALIELWVSADEVALAVTDDGIPVAQPLDYPRVVPYRVEDEHGGGLRVVQAHTDWWDWAVNPDGGITVRCAIARGWHR